MSMGKLHQKMSLMYLWSREHILRFFTSDLQRKIASRKTYQRKAYDRLKKLFWPIYLNINQYKIDKFVTAHWNEYNRLLESQFIPFPPFSFLRNPIIMFTMFATRGGDVLNNQCAYLESRLNSKKLRKFLEEDYTGEPLIMDRKYLTSHNTIDHLYHIMQFEEITKYEVKEAKTVVEWGGGYGNMARIIRKLNPTCTYVLIDTPFLSCLQWLYLASIFGKQHINFIQSKKARIQNNKLNILPLNFLELHHFQADLFISTWALSESSKFSQDYVVKRRWFGAKHIFIAYQKSNKNLPHAVRIGELAKMIGAIISNIKVLPGNYYALR